MMVCSSSMKRLLESTWVTAMLHSHCYGVCKGGSWDLFQCATPGSKAVWNDPEFQKIREKLAKEEPRTPDAPVAFRLADPKLIPEGIAYDPKQDRFFIGSVAQKKIVSANRKGEVKDFSKPEDNLDCVLGLFVDAAHEQLYAVSTNGFLDEAQKQRRNAVVRYDLKNGSACKSVRRTGRQPTQRSHHCGRRNNLRHGLGKRNALSEKAC